VAALPSVNEINAAVAPMAQFVVASIRVRQISARPTIAR